jgi:hypothetical protein
MATNQIIWFDVLVTPTREKCHKLWHFLNCINNREVCWQ